MFLDPFKNIYQYFFFYFSIVLNFWVIKSWLSGCLPPESQITVRPALEFPGVLMGAETSISPKLTIFCSLLLSSSNLSPPAWIICISALLRDTFFYISTSLFPTSMWISWFAACITVANSMNLAGAMQIHRNTEPKQIWFKNIPHEVCYMIASTLCSTLLGSAFHVRQTLTWPRIWPRSLLHRVEWKFDSILLCSPFWQWSFASVLESFEQFCTKYVKHLNI